MSARNIYLTQSQVEAVVDSNHRDHLRILQKLRDLLALHRAPKRPRVQQALPKSDRRADQRARRKTAKAEWNDCKREVLMRSGGVCELCRVRTGVDFHHAFGGKNRRSMQSPRSVIHVCRVCHDDIGGPNALEWALCQLAHLARYGFREEAVEMQKRIDLLNDRAALAVKAEANR